MALTLEDEIIASSPLVFYKQNEDPTLGTLVAAIGANGTYGIGPITAQRLTDPITSASVLYTSTSPGNNFSGFATAPWFSINNNEITVECLMNLDNSSANPNNGQNILRFADSSAQNGFQLIVNHVANTISFNWFNGGVTAGGTFTAFQFGKTDFFGLIHVVATMSVFNSRMRIFVNNISQTSISGPFGIGTIPPTVSFEIGGTFPNPSNSFEMNGRLQDVAVYAGEFNQIAVSQHFSKVIFTPPPGSPVPVSVLPQAGDPAGGEAVVIQGNSFNLGGTPTLSQIKFGGVNISAFNGTATASSIPVITPPHALGIVDIFVENQDLQNGTGIGIFEYVVLPSISFITPTSGTTLGGDIVTINGSNFDSNATVTINGIPPTITNFINNGQMTITTPNSIAGFVVIQITNPNSGFVSNTASYQYVNFVADDPLSFSGDVDSVIFEFNIIPLAPGSFSGNVDSPVFELQLVGGGSGGLGWSGNVDGPGFELQMVGNDPLSYSGNVDSPIFSLELVGGLGFSSNVNSPVFELQGIGGNLLSFSADVDSPNFELQVVGSVGFSPNVDSPSFELQVVGGNPASFSPDVDSPNFELQVVAGNPASFSPDGDSPGFVLELVGSDPNSFSFPDFSPIFQLTGVSFSNGGESGNVDSDLLTLTTTGIFNTPPIIVDETDGVVITGEPFLLTIQSGADNEELNIKYILTAKGATNGNSQKISFSNNETVFTDTNTDPFKIEFIGPTIFTLPQFQVSLDSSLFTEPDVVICLKTESLITGETSAEICSSSFVSTSFMFSMLWLIGTTGQVTTKEGKENGDDNFGFFTEWTGVGAIGTEIKVTGPWGINLGQKIITDDIPPNLGNNFSFLVRHIEGTVNYNIEIIKSASIGGGIVNQVFSITTTTLPGDL